MVVGEERIHLRTLRQASLVESDAEIQFHQGEDIGDWARAQSEPVAQLLRVLFCQFDDIASVDAPFGRVILRPLNAENVLQLDLSSNEIIQQLHCLAGMLILGFAQSAEAWHKVSMNCLAAQQGIHRYPVMVRKRLKLLNANSPIPLFNRNEGGARHAFELERIGGQSYLSIAGWATQTLRINADQGQIPVALPAFDYRRNIEDPVLGGKVQLQANTLSLIRTDGQDTQRAFAGARWDMRTLTGLGQVVTLTGLVRGDVYNTNDTLSTLTAVYRGNEGWTVRGIATAAADIEWPFVGEAFGGTQVLTPRVQLVASPPIRNLAVPNEDARAIDLEDSNLFALNRFPGYDRVEDGTRVTYGIDWELTKPGWRVKTNIGQSYRLTTQEDIFPDGTGLSDRFSDFVGRTEVRYRNFLAFTHRFRLDKDDFRVRRNEIDATIGSQSNYVEIGYLRLNRDIQTVEDLQDREEIRAAARFTIGPHWSVFGSGVFNLTSAAEDPLFTPDGFEPIRTRLGVAYSDDCIEFGATWRRDYITAGDAERGNSFQVFFALKNLGFR